MERTSSEKHVLARHSSPNPSQRGYLYMTLVRGVVVTKALLLAGVRRGMINIFPDWLVQPGFPRWHGTKSGAAKRDLMAALLSA